jgi:hypothetical protein
LIRPGRNKIIANENNAKIIKILRGRFHLELKFQHIVISCLLHSTVI